MADASLLAAPKPEELVERLSSLDSEVKLKAVRVIKNQIIGSKLKKLAYLSLATVPKLVDILAHDTEPSLLVQAATALGSFSYGVAEGAQEVVKHGGVVHLLAALSHTIDEVVEAGIRALRQVYQSGVTPCDPALAPKITERLVTLLWSSNPVVSEVAADVLSHCCSSVEEQEEVASHGALQGLVPLLSSTRKTAQEASLAALAALTHSSAKVSTAVLSSCSGVVSQLVTLARHRSVRVRLLACTCLTNLGPGMTSTSDPTAARVGEESEAQQLPGARRQVLPVLVRLLSETGVSEEVPPVLARLIADSEELQKAAADADAIRLLSSFLQEPASSARLREGTLHALGTLCMNRDESRRQLVEAKVLKSIIRSLEEPHEGVRAAAALCIRAATRSVKNLRNAVIDAEVAIPLCRLLHDASPDVQCNAASALANLVMEFSPAKDAVVKAGAVSRLAAMTTSMVVAVRQNAAWVLKNLTFKCIRSVKSAVIEELTWPSMKLVLADPEECVQREALALLRNLVDGPAADVTLVMEWAGRELLGMLEEKLDPSIAMDVELREHALYTVVNLCTGESSHKDAVTASNIPQLLLHHLRDTRSPKVRLPAVWCVINLTYPPEAELMERESTELQARLRRLRELGMEEALRTLQQDPCQDVRERVKTALDQLH